MDEKNISPFLTSRLNMLFILAAPETANLALSDSLQVLRASFRLSG